MVKKMKISYILSDWIGGRGKAKITIYSGVNHPREVRSFKFSVVPARNLTK